MDKKYVQLWTDNYSLLIKERHYGGINLNDEYWHRNEKKAYFDWY